ncbi:MAG: DinB family protein [Fimbriimonadaceae bacterium]|nr:DinB family protein [Fimbriimonadaceae bacterium]
MQRRYPGDAAGDERPCHDSAMANLDLLVAALDMAHWELGEAFKGLPDEDVWRRPHPRLWSVGELAAHIAYGEDTNVTGGSEGNPFRYRSARYYEPFEDEPLVMDFGAEALYRAVEEVHAAVKAILAANPPDGDAVNPHRPDWNWRQTLEYMVFHVAYHTGQIYSARHLLGHETVDN